MSVRLQWSAFSSVEVSYKLSVSSSVISRQKWRTPAQSRNIKLSAAGQASVALAGLKTGSEYVVRVTPIVSLANGNQSLRRSQAVTFKVNTN